MNEQEMHRLAHALNELRPDWPISSLTTFVKRELLNRPYRDACVAMVWVATDMRPDGTPASDTPRRVLEAGPWWRAALIDSTVSTRAHAPKRSEECLSHPGQPAINCGGCRTDKLAVDRPPSPPARTRGADPETVKRMAAAARAAMKKAPAEEDTDE